ncbi:dephospho-CoA kinase [Kaistia soli DSM 19436]|uniref:Dephospho-CoA kinase n=1 Tax=Kaistia soli DSM 19436 TaxID=1122133 RepID=A0A1M5CWA6_9HYPH|nr:dephospho-CoA kinase [Kaistia soli]SHF59070.1 dephospho-CoA kinase [Kaistia soli DSM 19436]
MITLGLTGSIGMGKSTTAAMFAARGAAVYNADTAVHALYRPGGAAVAPVSDLFPDAVKDGTIDRGLLGALVQNDPARLAALEAVVHPLVRAEERAFRVAAHQAGRLVAVLDIPLLLETQGESRVDAVVVVSAPEAIQRDRVLARPGMTEARFKVILARQMADGEKRRRAHFIVPTGSGLSQAARTVDDILRAVAPVAAARGTPRLD